MCVCVRACVWHFFLFFFFFSLLIFERVDRPYRTELSLRLLFVARYRVCLYGRRLWLDDVIRKMERTFCLKKEGKKGGL